MKPIIEKCLTVTETAARLRIGATKVREMIRKGILGAIDIGLAVGRTQLRIRPEDLAAFEGKAAVQMVVPKRKRRTEDDGISESVRKILDGE